MADRRMFAKTIIDSDAFLEMPLSSQCLYFHLSMRADDDGFLNNPKKVQRMICASEDDLKLLITKKFLIPFESGVVVIKHWRIHNYIQKDRYKPTVYAEEKAQLRLKDNKAYSLTDGNELDTVCVQEEDTQAFTNWKTSPRARNAIAGKLIGEMEKRNSRLVECKKMQTWLVIAMEKGISPYTLKDEAEKADKADAPTAFLMYLGMNGVGDEGD